VSQKKEFQEAFNMAVENTRWMAAVWSVDEEGKIHLSTTTNSFLYDDFDKAVKMLTMQLEQRAMCERSELPPPLPTADPFPWMKNDLEENCTYEIPSDSNDLAVRMAEEKQENDSTEVGQQVAAGCLEGDQGTGQDREETCQEAEVNPAQD